MSELLWLSFALVLPLAVWSGYRIGRRRNSDDSETNSGPSKGYFIGLNYLLNEQPDKAIDVFIEQIQLNNEVVETHLALGNLFRRRGEVDRAIRIHQNLIARPSLASKTRKLALSELAHDYLAAGLYDRAEHLFVELTEDSKHRKDALKSLLSVYQQLKEWQKAINACRQLDQLESNPDKLRLSHLYCELADERQLTGEAKEAEAAIKQALQVDPQGLRPNLLQAKNLADRGAYKKAIKIYQSLIHTQPQFLSEFLPSLHQCHQNQETEHKFTKDLKLFLEQQHSPELLSFVSDYLTDPKDQEEIRQWLISHLTDKPSLDLLSKLILIYKQDASERELQRLEQIDHVIERVKQTQESFQCEACGYESHSLFWQCPACKNWGRMMPKHAISSVNSFLE